MANEQMDEARKRIVKLLRDPFKLRLVMLTLLWVAGYALLVKPLDSKITVLKRKLAEEKARAGRVEEMTRITREMKPCEGRVQKCQEFNEWSQAIISTTRDVGLLVRTLEHKDTKKLGPYHVLSVKVETVGEYFAMLQFIRWLEDPIRANRIDRIRVKRETDYLYATFEIRGLVERNGPDV